MKERELGAGDLFEAGVAKRPIDLPTGVLMAGFGLRDGPSEGTLAPLEARAFACGRGSDTAVVVALDILYVNQALTDAIRQGVAASADVSPRCVIVCGTHTHAGPYIGDPAAPVGRAVVRAGVEAGREAVLAKRPVRLWGLTVPIAGVAMNRRRGAMPIDPAARLIVATTAEDTARVVATLVTLACHPTSIDHRNRLWSPDFPGHLRESLDRQLGGTSLFLQGCSADVNPVVSSFDASGARLLATAITGPIAGAAAAALRTLAGTRYANLSMYRDLDATSGRTPREFRPGLVRAAESALTARLAPVPGEAESLAQLEALKHQWRAEADQSARDAIAPLLARTEAVDYRARGDFFPEMMNPTESGTVELAITALHLGDELAFVTLPGEVFEATGEAIRQRAPAGLDLVCVTCANGSVGYLPPRDEYARHGYEVGAAYTAQGTAEAVLELVGGVTLGPPLLT